MLRGPPNCMQSTREGYKSQFHDQGKSKVLLKISINSEGHLGTFFSFSPLSFYFPHSSQKKALKTQIRSCHFSALNPSMVPHPTPCSTQGKIQSPCWSAPQVIFSLLSGDLLSFPPRLHSAPEVLAALLFSTGPFLLSGLVRFFLCPVVSHTDCLWLFISVRSLLHQGFPGGSDSKESACNAGDLCSNPPLGRSPGGGHGGPLQYSCWRTAMDRGAWWATVHGVTKSWIWLSD